MNFIGIDLHKKTISLCVVDKGRSVLRRAKFSRLETDELAAFCTSYAPFEAVVEATAGYDWLVDLLEPLSHRVLLAHAKKLRVIAESTRKSDKLDAQVLAEFLALDMIPQAHRPTPRQREHRMLVRHRRSVSCRLTGVRCRIRSILARWNLDRDDLFTGSGRKYLRSVKVSPAERFVLDDLADDLEQLEARLAKIESELAKFARKAPVAEREARAILNTIPQVGAVTIDVVVSELGDVSRFRSQKRACAYAGLVPGQRESAGKSRQLRITKEGSPLLRWALVEAAWRLVRLTAYWRSVFQALEKARGRKKAIVAVARRLLCVMVAMLKSGRSYQLVGS